jgi:hypothetical protein
LEQDVPLLEARSAIDSGTKCTPLKQDARACHWNRMLLLEKNVHGLRPNVRHWNKMTALATRCPPLENQIRRWKQYLLLKQDGRPSSNMSAIRKRSLPLKTISIM